MRLAAFFKLYKICILLHRCNLKNPKRAFQSFLELPVESKVRCRIKHLRPETDGDGRMEAFDILVRAKLYIAVPPPTRLVLTESGRRYTLEVDSYGR